MLHEVKMIPVQKVVQKEWIPEAMLANGARHLKGRWSATEIVAADRRPPVEDGSSTLTNSTSGVRLASASNCGAMRRQGAHHVAVNCTTKSFPSVRRVS